MPLPACLRVAGSLPAPLCEQPPDTGLSPDKDLRSPDVITECRGNPCSDDRSAPCGLTRQKANNKTCGFPEQFALR